jgi:hypothetical protein
MNMKSRRGSLLIIALVGWFGSLAVQAPAQVIHPDQMIGIPELQKEAVLEDGVKSNELAVSDLEKGFDRPMMAPESGSISSMEMNMLKTPDNADVENARESDGRSAVSF